VSVTAAAAIRMGQVQPGIPQRPGVVVRAAASACLFRDGSVLLVERGKAPNAGAWSLPGGSVEPGERSAEAARREVAEETGLACAIAGFAGMDDVILRDTCGAVTHHFVIAVFWGHAGAGEPIAASDARDARFVTPAELATIPLTGGMRALIALARQAHDAAGSAAVPTAGIGAMDSAQLNADE
jgi:8-oxo-dGTP diphosphatase